MKFEFSIQAIGYINFMLDQDLWNNGTLKTPFMFKHLVSTSVAYKYSQGDKINSNICNVILCWFTSVTVRLYSNNLRKGI